jgi:hypothetical protein
MSGGLVLSPVAMTPRGSRNLGHEIARSRFEDEMGLVVTHRRRLPLGIAALQCGRRHDGAFQGLYTLADRRWLFGLVLVECLA